MTVYVDNAHIRAKVGRSDTTWCHLGADSPEELLAFAITIGLEPRWIQYPGTVKEHFDVTPARRRLAVEAGAVEVTYREFVTRLIRLRARGAEHITTTSKPPTTKENP